MRLLAPLLLAILLAGCASTPAATPVTPTGPAPERAEPAALAWESPLKLGEATNGAEPQVLVTRSGAVYVHTPLQLWRSDDGGATFAALGEPVCDAPQGVGLPGCAGGATRPNPGLRGPGDGALVEHPDGTLLWAGLGGGAAVPFQTSADRGESWSEPIDLAEPGADREWLAARGDGAVLAVWRVVNSAIVSRVSPDGGATWNAPVEVFQDSILGAPVVAPSGAFVVPIYDMWESEGLRLARSDDNGTTWEIRTAFESPNNAPVRNGGPIAAMPVAAFDDAGTLHVAWSVGPLQAQTFGVKAADVPSVFLISSPDEGQTWSEPVQVSPPGKAAILPWLVAGSAGRVALAWYENARGVPNEFVPDEWRVATAVVRDAASAAPVVETAYVTEAAVHVGQMCTDGFACSLTARERSQLDFLGLGLLPDGRLLVAYAGNGGVPRGPIGVFAARASGDVGLH